MNIIRSLWSSLLELILCVLAQLSVPPRLIAQTRERLSMQIAINVAAGCCACVVILVATATFFAPHFALQPLQLTAVPTRSALPAVVTIATNGYDSSILVKSLRHEGGFGGKIFVFGDSCSPIPDAADDVVFVDVSKLLESSSLLPLSSSSSSASSKRLKQSIFDLLPEDIGRVLYLDSDIQVNFDVGQFMAEMTTPEKKTNDDEGDDNNDDDVVDDEGASSASSALASDAWATPCSAYLFRERDHVKSVWNGGAMLLDRRHSAALLSAWG